MSKLNRLLINLSVLLLVQLNQVHSDYSSVELKVKHDRMLEKLLHILDQSVSIGVIPRMQQLIPKRKTESTPRTPGGFLKQTKASSAAGHYQLGHLGFVPTEDTKFPTLLEKVPLLSSTTKYKLNKLDQLLA